MRPPELPRRSRPRQLERPLISASVIIIYCHNRFATLTPLEYTELLLSLLGHAEQRRKQLRVVKLALA